MQNYVKMLSFGKEKVFFCDDAQEIAKQISKHVPYSKVITLWIENEYFDYGKTLDTALLKEGINVYNVIIKDNFCATQEKFLNLGIKAEDCRAIVCCNSKLFSFVMSVCVNFEFSFYIAKGGNLNGLFVQNFFIKKDGELHSVARKRQGYIIVDTCNLEEQELVKSIATQTLALTDYLFRRELLGKPIEINFFSKANALLKSALKIVYSVGEERLSVLAELSFSLEQLLCEKQCFYQSACAVLCFLQTGDFFTNNFEYAKKIANLYKNALNKTISKPTVDYHQDVVALSFLTGLKLAYLTKGALKNLNMITNRKERLYLLQKRQLLAIFNKLCATLKTGQEKSMLSQKDFDFLSTLAGLTPLGINGITAIYD